MDEPSSRKRVTADVSVTNCTPATVAIAFRIVPTRYTQRGDGLEVCTGAPEARQDPARPRLSQTDPPRPHGVASSAEGVGSRGAEDAV